MFPPLTTVILLGVPENWLIGIDLSFFNATPQLKGIKLIPDGPHVIHWGQDQNSVRTGRYFYASQATEVDEDESGTRLLVLQWDASSESMLINEGNLSGIKAHLGEFYPFMVKYPETEGSIWPVITDHITDETLLRILPGRNRLISSTSTSKEENQLLLRSLRDSARMRHEQSNLKKEDPELEKRIHEDQIIQSLVDQDSEEVKFTGIDIKRSWPAGSTGRDVTIYSQDKSWYLNHLLDEMYDGSMDELLAEFQLSFVSMVIFANYSAAQQWKKITELMLRCRADLLDHSGRFIEFLMLVYHHIKTCPREYLDEFLEVGFMEVVFGHFKRTLRGEPTNSHESVINIPLQLKAAASRVFDTLLRVGIRVSDTADDEEDEDEQPVIVET